MNIYLVKLWDLAVEGEELANTKDSSPLKYSQFLHPGTSSRSDLWHLREVLRPRRDREVKAC